MTKNEWLMVLFALSPVVAYVAALGWLQASYWKGRWRIESDYARAAWDIQRNYPELDGLALKLYREYVAYDEAEAQRERGGGDEWWREKL